ncbi:pseudouridine synthase [Sphingobium sp. YR768]|uniref:pseudouridine synthase n=1 Tax=Sphingobium sp. YR768 TaxID=1884365 RepID=UPI0008B4AE7E|nr:pseudouridine synthase [Sphingobium sp. YR768]SER87295.1 23S rRNA pseudouridine2605 synthase [Sphingobium sp. YR768]
MGALKDARGNRSEGERSDRPRFDRGRPDRDRTDGSRFGASRDARGSRGDGERAERPRFDRGRSDRARPEGSRFGAPRDARSEGERSERQRPERTRTDAPRSGAPRDARTKRSEGDRAERPRFDRNRAVAPKSYPPRKPGGKKPAPAGPANPHPAHAAAEGTGEPQRIAKLLARAGVASRREIERMIEEGRVAKDGVALDTPATLLTSLRGVTVDGVAVAAPEPTRLFLFHKPTGYLTTERDPAGRPTIYDRLPADLPRLMPIGRLDMNTEGLLLMTSDGGFKRQMELPSSGVPRTYRARAFGEVSQQQLEDLFDGVEIDGIRYGQIEANLERRTGRNQWIEMTLAEGKNREVRRVLEHLDLKVNRLIRTSYGPFHLGELPVGAVEEVRQHDLDHFRASLKVAPK